MLPNTHDFQCVNRGRPFVLVTSLCLRLICILYWYWYRHKVPSRLNFSEANIGQTDILPEKSHNVYSFRSLSND